MVAAKSRCSSVSGVSSNRPLMPMTAFIGVRISWLIVARNALLASLALSACSRAASAWARASCASLNSRAFWIAITAWSAKVSSSAISLAVNVAHWRAAPATTNSAPMAAPLPEHRRDHDGEISPILAAMRRMTSGTLGPCSASG